MPLMNLPRPVDQGEGYGPQQIPPVDSTYQGPQEPDAVNQWLKAQPWYRATMQAWGTNPDKPTLSIQQRAQIMAAAYKAGVSLGGDQGVNTNGEYESTKMPTAVKVALIGFGIAAGGAGLAAIGGGGAATSAAGPLAAGYGTATTEAAVPAALDAAWGTAAATGAAGATTAAGTAAAEGAADATTAGAFGPMASGYAGATTAAAPPSALASAAGGGLPWSTMLKYGIPAVQGAVGSYLDQKNSDANRGLTQEQIALNQSNLDPFRNTMAQTKDVAKLEHAANPPKTYGVGADSKYAGAVNTTTGGYRGYTPSSTYLNTVRNAQQQVASGQGQTPNMMDEANWGKSGATDLTAPTTAAPGSTLAPPPAPPAMPPRLSTGGQPAPPMKFNDPATDQGDPNDPNSPAAMLARYQSWRMRLPNTINT